MKITAGMGCVEDYPAFVRAGADEVFGGYVPAWWEKKYGPAAPLNRREVIYYQVQLGAASELEILKKMEKLYRVPAALTFNALSFRPDQYRDVLRVMDECREIGFSSFIIADPALLCYLKAHCPAYADGSLKIHISGELAVMNEGTVRFLKKLGFDRLIFPRQTGIREMARLTAAAGPGYEYEAFLLNEKCHFTGAYCSSLHCDELGFACHLPWRLTKKTEFSWGEETEDRKEESPEMREPQVKKTKMLTLPVENPEMRKRQEAEKSEPCRNLPPLAPAAGFAEGEGCGLCRLPDLKAAGVTHLKIVGRGKDADGMCQDIRLVRRQLQALEEGRFQADGRSVFGEDCGGNCYYAKP